MSTELPKDCPSPSTNPEDKSLDDSDEIVLAAKFEAIAPQSMSSNHSSEVQFGEQVLGYLEVQPSDLGVDQENATIFLQPQEIEIDGQHVILTQEGDSGNEIIVVVTNPDSPLWDTDQDNQNPTKSATSPLTQSTVINSSATSADNSERTRTLIVGGGHVGQRIELIGSNLVESSADSVEPVSMCSESEMQCSSAAKTDSTEISSSSWNIPTSKLQENEDSTEMLFIPTPSVLSSSGGLTTSLVLSTSEVEPKHRGLMQLACIAQKLQSSSDKINDRSEPHSSENCHDTQILDSHDTDVDEFRIKPQDQDISSSSYVLTEVSESLQESQDIGASTSLSADTTVTSSSNNACFSSCAITNKLVSDQSLPALSSHLPDTCSITVDQTSSNLEVSSSSSCTSELETNLAVSKTVTENSFTSKDVVNSDDDNSSVKENVQLDVTEELSRAGGKKNLDASTVSITGCVDSFQTITESIHSSPAQIENSAVFSLTKDAEHSADDDLQPNSPSQSPWAETVSSNSDLAPKDPLKPHILTVVNVDSVKSHKSEEESFSPSLLNTENSVIDGSGSIASYSLINESDHSPKDSDPCISTIAACIDSDLSLVKNSLDLSCEPGSVCNGSSESLNDVEMQEDNNVYLEKNSNPSVEGSDSSCEIVEEVQLESSVEILDIPKTLASNMDMERETLTDSSKYHDQDSHEDHGITGSLLSTVGALEIPVSSESVAPETNSNCDSQNVDKPVKQSGVGLKTSVASSLDKETLKRKLNEYDFEDDSVTEIKAFEDERCSKKPRLASRLQEEYEIKMAQPSSEKMEKCPSVAAASPTIIRISVDCPQDAEEVNSDVLSSSVSVPASNLVEFAATSDSMEVCEFIEGKNEAIAEADENVIVTPLGEENVQQDSDDINESLSNVAVVDVIKNEEVDVEIVEPQIEPPKKTYTRQSKPKTNTGNGVLKNEPPSKEVVEIELFSCDGLGETSQSDMDPAPAYQSEDISADLTQQNGDVEDDEALSSGIEKRVSTTYKGVKGLVEKKKLWSLRTRTSSLKMVVKEPEASPKQQKRRAGESTPSKPAKKTKLESASGVGVTADTTDVQASSSVENSPTKIQSKTASANSGDEVVNTGVAVSPSKRSKTKSLKNKPASVILWEKLVKSPPGKVKTSKFFSSMKRRQIKSSVFKVKPVPSHSFCLSPKTSRMKHKRTLSEPPVPTDAENRVNLALTPLKPIDIRIRCQPSPGSPDKSNIYQCGNCKFKCNRLENLIQHYKARCLREGSDMFELGINDMDRRQRIRGEDTNDTSDARPYSMCGLSRSSYSDDNGFLKQSGEYSDGDSDDEISMNVDKPSNNFGFKEGDIVWAEWKNIFWPSLVRRVYPKERKVFVFLVGTPVEKKCMKINVAKIQPFDNAELNKKLLSKGGGFADKEVFVKAVQKAEDFVRKKLLGMSVNPTQFFENLDDSNADISDVESSSSQSEKQGEKPSVPSVDDESAQQTSASSVLLVSDNDGGAVDECPRTTEKMSDVLEERPQKLVKCIKDGNVDEHLLGILNCSIPRERHRSFHVSDVSHTDQLKNETWFGPVHNEKEQLDISDYCMHLLKSQSADKGTFDRISYIFEVWVPEAIIKAISLVEDVPLFEAEEIFIKDGVEKSDPCADTSSTSEENHKEKLLLRMRDAFVTEEIAQALSE